MWYCRRKRSTDDDEKPGSFNPARDSVLDPVINAKDSDKKSAQILSMDDPAAWTEAYSAAYPQQLDSHSIRRPRTDNSGDQPREIAESLSGLSSTHGSRKTTYSADVSMGSSPIGGRLSGEEGLTELVSKPSLSMTRNRRSFQNAVELPA